VARELVLATGVAQTNDQPVDGLTGAKGAQELLPRAGVLRGRLTLLGLAVLAHKLGL
jgi:hypothetical protein